MQTCACGCGGTTTATYKRGHHPHRRSPCGTHSAYCAGCRCEACRHAGRRYREEVAADPVRHRKRREAQARYNAKNRDAVNAKRNAKRKQRVAEAQAYVRRLKEATPCADCGASYPHFVMDFDHRPGTKRNGYRRGTVSHLVRNSPNLDVLRAEIAKCELVCANCHRSRHYGG